MNPVVTEELNGIFKLEFDYPILAPHGDGLLPERIVRCPVPGMDDQLFRIAEREATIGGIFHVVAYHVFYDLVQNLIEDTFIVNRSGQGAINQILDAGQFPHPFTGSSNIAAVNNARVVRLNIAEVLLDANLDNGFLSRWGGEIIRDNFHILMQTVRGSDNGVCIRDKKNLTGYRSDVDFGTVVTRIMPQGFDGLLLPEKYVDSPLIGNYLTPRIRVFRYDQVKAAVDQYANDEDAVPLPEAHAALRTLAAQEFSINHVDIPNATYQVEFAPLERTEEYKAFAMLETIAIGDTVRVIHEEDGLDISARMVGYQYDPLVQAYSSVTLGNYTPRFTDVAKELRRVETGVQQAVSDANFALQSANGKNSNYYGPAQPANPRKGDIWFKENGDKLEMWIYETREGATQWYPLMTDLTQEQIRLELEEMLVLVEEAKSKSEEAIEAGEAAQAAGQEALAAAGEAAIAGQEALLAGQAAHNAAEQAGIEAQAAVLRANQAFNSAADLSGRVSAAESTILQHAGFINLRVAKSEIINQINISTEGILIAGNKIWITGQTSIDNAVIKTAMIADLAVTTAKIADLAVSTAKIANLAVTTAKIGNLAVGTAQIADAAITNAKIANLDAGKINTGTLSADRIAAGSITSAKLTVANGFITNAMIADATIQSAKIAALDAGKITTGTLSADRIGANSITAAKLATDAIQVGLAGWTGAIRITPSWIYWYNGSTLEGSIDADGMNFFYGSRFIGRMGQSYDSNNNSLRGVSVHLNGEGDYMSWAYRTGTMGTFTRFLTLDPKGVMGTGAGIRLGTHLRTNGYSFFTSGNRGIFLADNTLAGAGTFPAWSSTNGNAKVTFGDTHLYFVTNALAYNVTNVFARVGELIVRMNQLISRLNYGWVVDCTGKTSSYAGTGLTAMSTTL